VSGSRSAAGWDDERLAAAFMARAAAIPPTPPDLVAAVTARIAREPRIRARSRSLGLLASAAAVIVILGVGGIAVMTLASRPLAASPPVPSGSGPIPSAARELGLTPIGVAEAVAIHNATEDDRELLVSGYLSNDPGGFDRDQIVVSCDRPSAISHLLSPYCTPMLMADPESIVTRTLTSVRVRTPSGPSFHAVFNLVGLPVTRAVPLVGNAVPSPITVVGHFHDRRAASCPIGSEQACKSSLVVDRIVEVDGAPVPNPASVDVASQAALETLTRALPDLLILSMRAFPREDLSALEPSVIDPGDIPAALDADQIWIIVALGPPDPSGAARTARTFLIGNGRATVVEMTATGPVTRSDVLSSPTPSDPGIDKTLLGLPIITVSDAIDRRDHHLDDSELVVRGFGWTPGLISCPMVVPDSPARAQCPSGFTWLADGPPPPRTGSSLAVPAGPAINLLIRDETANGFALDDQPRDVLVFGHFDDHRAPQCSPAIVEACRHNFIVDAIVDSSWLGYSSLPRSPFDGKAFHPKNEPPVEGNQEEAVMVAGDHRARAIFAAFPVEGPALRAYEPAAENLPALMSARAVWIVRYLDLTDGRYVLRTKLVIDGTVEEMRSAVYEATTSGVGPAAAAAGAPPADAGVGTRIAVYLGSDGGGPFVAEVFDRDRVLIGARSLEPAQADGLTWIRKVDPAGTATVEVADVPGRPGDVAVRWLAPVCRPALNVFGLGNNPGTVAVLPVVMTPACSLPMVKRTIVLEFRDPVRAAIVDVLSVSGG
jgi:hypothetical protein